MDLIRGVGLQDSVRRAEWDAEAVWNGTAFVDR